MNINECCGPFVNMEFARIGWTQTIAQAHTDVRLLKSDNKKEKTNEKKKEKIADERNPSAWKFHTNGNAVSLNDWKHNYESTKGLLLTIPVGCPFRLYSFTNFACTFLIYIQPTAVGSFRVFSFSNTRFFAFLFFPFSFSVSEKKKSKCVRYHWHGRINGKYQRKSNKTNRKENAKWNAQRTLLAYRTHILWFFILLISAWWRISLIII